MARAEIYLEDTDDGQIACNFRYLDGKPDVASGAHQVANAVRKYLDSIMTLAPDSEAVATSAPGEQGAPLAS